MPVDGIEIGTNTINTGDRQRVGGRQLFAVVEPAGLLVGILDFLLHVAHGVLEFTDTFSETFHEFRDLLRAKKHQDKNSNEEDFLETNTTQDQEDRFHLLCIYDGLPNQIITVKITLKIPNYATACGVLKMGRNQSFNHNSGSRAVVYLRI